MVKKLKRRPGHKQPVVPLLVSTSSGNTFMSSDSRVLVHVGGETYYEKNASELRPGDMVLYEIEFTTKDYDPSLLLDDPNFKEARDNIHVTDSNKHVPKLRNLLLRGMNDQGIIEAQDLESRIFQEPGDDFSPQEYRAMETHVHQLLTTSASSEAELRSRSAIEKWFTGETLAPSEWEIFRHLAQVHSGFSDIHQSFEQPEGFHASYLVYTITARAVARYFAQPKDPASLKPGDYSRRGLVSIRPIVENILKNHFGDCIDTKYRPSVVRSVERLEPSPKSNPGKEHPDPHLRRGVYVVDENSPTVKKVGLRELFEDSMMVEKAVMDLISTYVKKNFDGAGQFDLGTMNYGVTHRVMYGLTPQDSANTYWYKTRVGSVPDPQRADEYTQQIVDAINDGSIDAEFHLPRFRVKEAFRTFNDISRQVPSGFKAWWVGRNKMNELEFKGREDRELTNRVKDLYRNYVEPHGISKHYLGVSDAEVQFPPSLTASNPLGDAARELGKRFQESISQHVTKLTHEKMSDTLTRYQLQDFKRYVLFTHHNQLATITLSPRILS